MKTLLSLFVLSFALVGCGSGDSSTPTAKQEPLPPMTNDPRIMKAPASP